MTNSYFKSRALAAGDSRPLFLSQPFFTKESLGKETQ